VVTRTRYAGNKRTRSVGDVDDFADAKIAADAATANRHRSPHAMPAAQEIYHGLTAARAACINRDRYRCDSYPLASMMAVTVRRCETRVGRAAPASANRLQADAHGLSMAVPQTSPCPALRGIAHRK